MHDELETHFQNNNIEKYLQVNFRYNQLIQKLAGNKTLSNIIESLKDKILLSPSKQLVLEGRFKQSILEQRDLLLAYQGKKANEAKKIMVTHLQK